MYTLHTTLLNCFRRILTCCEKINYVQRARAEHIDMSCMARRPTLKEQFGIFLILLSYVLGWPAVAGFAFLSMYLKEPLVLIIGGPSIYGFSHVLFIAGIYIAGRQYAAVLVKWSIKKAYEKMPCAGKTEKCG